MIDFNKQTNTNSTINTPSMGIILFVGALWISVILIITNTLN